MFISSSEVFKISRRVLFSFLGKGNYKPYIYSFGNFKATVSRFVQTAIYEYLAEQDSKPEVVVFVTKEAENENWNKVFEEGISFSEQVKKEGLFNAFQRIASTVSLKKVMIPSTQNEEGNWKLFDIILNEVQEGDLIYFDITHSFRTIPLISLIVLNYARFIKGATIGKLLYGSIEYGESETILVAPIVDFTPMVTLLDWSHGINQYLRAGDASTILKLVEDEWKQVKDIVGSDEREMIGKLLNMSNQMQQVNLSLQTVRGRDVINELRLLTELIKEVEEINTNHIKALIPLIDKIKEKLAEFTEDPAEQDIFIVEWCLNHNLIQQGLTFLRENIITACCQLCNLDYFRWKDRDAVSKAIYVLDLPPEKWRASKEQLKIINQIFPLLSPYKRYLNGYKKLVKIRNDINHAGMQIRPKQATELKKELSKLHKQIKPFFKKVYADIAMKEGM